MNLFHRFWPELTRADGFLCNFATPLIKVRRRNEEVSFFTMAGSHWRGSVMPGRWARSMVPDLVLVRLSMCIQPMQSTSAGARPRRRLRHGQSSTTRVWARPRPRRRANTFRFLRGTCRPSATTGRPTTAPSTSPLTRTAPTSARRGCSTLGTAALPPANGLAGSGPPLTTLPDFFLAVVSTVCWARRRPQDRRRPLSPPLALLVERRPSQPFSTPTLSSFRSRTLCAPFRRWSMD